MASIYEMAAHIVKQDYMTISDDFGVADLLKDILHVCHVYDNDYGKYPAGWVGEHIVALITAWSNVDRYPEEQGAGWHIEAEAPEEATAAEQPE